MNLTNLLLSLIAASVLVTHTSTSWAEQSRLSAVVAQAATPTAETPEKFRSLLGRWRYDENPRFVSTFEVLSIGSDGVGVIRDYRVGGREVPQATFIVTDDRGEIAVKIQLGEGAWNLTYSKTSGGMLAGQLTLGGRAPIGGRFYREK